MPFIDFREIPEAHLSSGEQDTFELFARDFLVDIFKFEVISEPSRGADGGKDLLVVERKLGTLSESKTIWLVSCKHKAHSGNSVNPSDEENISDRLSEHNAEGFIGFYSTLVSSGLGKRLDAMKCTRPIEIFDWAKIEHHLISNKRFELFKRYFPLSYVRWLEAEGKQLPTKLMSSYQPLCCEVCGKDLLCIPKEPRQNHGIIGFVYKMDADRSRYIDCYVACLGNCDRTISAYHHSTGNITTWNSLSDLLIPTYYLQIYMGILNQLYDGRFNFEPEAFQKYKDILISIGQMVFRHQTEDELNRIKTLNQLPF